MQHIQFVANFTLPSDPKTKSLLLEFRKLLMAKRAQHQFENTIEIENIYCYSSIINKYINYT